MLFSRRLSIFSQTRGNTYRGRKVPRRRNQRELDRMQQPVCCGPSVEVLEGRQMLSAAAAYEPMIVIAGRVSAPTSGGTVTPATTTEASAPYTPAQMTTAYNVNQISFNGVVGNGAGQTIAIVDAYNDPDIISDAATFNSTFNLPQFNVASGPTFQVLNQTGGTSLPTTDGQGWDLEESLDVEWAHSIAPQANIILYESNTNNDPDMDQAVATAAANPAVSVVSMSWGEDEFQGEQSEDPFVLTPTGRTGGVTFLAATGDWDSPAIYPAFSPDVVAVGGTSLQIQSDGTYISESVWNNNNGYGTGGGISQYEPLPAYQDGLNGINGASTTNRNVPDISMDADPDTGVYVLDTYSGGWYQVGGTSLATPLTAALVSIANQGRALNGEPSLNGLTQTLPTLYNLSSSDFHDITVGGNGTYNAAPWIRPGERVRHANRQSARSRPGQHEHQLVAHRDRPGLGVDQRKHVAGLLRRQCHLHHRSDRRHQHRYADPVGQSGHAGARFHQQPDFHGGCQRFRLDGRLWHDRRPAGGRRRTDL